MIGKILLHIRKNPSKTRRWQTSFVCSIFFKNCSGDEAVRNMYPCNAALRTVKLWLPEGD